MNKDSAFDRVGKKKMEYWGDAEQLQELINTLSDTLIDPNVNNVIEPIKARSEKGLEEYGTDTKRDDYNALDWLNEAQSEAMDLSIYLEVIKQKYIKFQELIKNTPNDSQLGRKIRKIYG